MEWVQEPPPKLRSIWKYKNLHRTSREPTSTGTSKHVNHSVSWEHENIKGEEDLFCLRPNKRPHPHCSLSVESLLNWPSFPIRWIHTEIVKGKN